MIDKYLNMNLIFDVGTNDEHRGTMVKSSQGTYGRYIGQLHTNSFFDTREYEIYFTYRTQDKYATNVIADNMYEQVDDKGCQFQLLVEIQDHRKYVTEISKGKGKIRYSNGTYRDNITTK